MKHSTGWRLDRHMDRIAAIRHDVDDSRGTCCWRPDNAHYPTREGDFYLLAAASDLLAACEAFCAAIEYRGKIRMGEDLLPDESNWRDYMEPYLLEVYDQAKAAIALARGTNGD